MNNYNQADQQLHRLSQLLAKAGRTFLKQKDDDSHTNLAFNETKNRLETHPITDASGSDSVQLTLRLVDVCFEWIDDEGVTIRTISTAKKSIAEIEKQLESGAKSCGLKTEGFSDPMHYEIPEYHFQKQPVQLLSRLALNEWVYWRTKANEACRMLAKALNTDVTPRIWPHHFDTGSYIQYSDDLGIGFGLAIKDETIGSPYFYARTYQQNITDLFSDNIEVGELLSEPWNGAVLPLTNLLGEENDHQKSLLTTFCKSIIEAISRGN